VAYQVIGNELAAIMAAKVGPLELNVMEPIIAFYLLHSMQFLTNAFNTLATECISGITANDAHCREMFYNSIGIVTAVNSYLGYQESRRTAKEALETGVSIIALIRRDKLMSDELLEEVLKPENMTQPHQMK